MQLGVRNICSTIGSVSGADRPKSELLVFTLLQPKMVCPRDSATYKKNIYFFDRLFQFALGRKLKYKHYISQTLSTIIWTWSQLSSVKWGSSPDPY